MHKTGADREAFYTVRDELRWHRVFFLCLIGVTGLRILFLYLFPYDLSPDEAYYWDWSRHLSWGYYSKPPMVAWLIALSTSLFGATEFGVRLPATILGTCTLMGLYVVGFRMFDARTGFFAALVFFVTIGSAVSSMIMTIDAPLLCFWAMSMVLVWQAWQSSATAEPGGPALLWWTIAGAVAGLGLLSKQTMVAFTLGTILFLVVNARTRRLLGSLEPYLFLAVQISLIFPVLAWNQQHGWVTLQHTAHHFETSSRGMIPNFKTFFELLATQAGVVTPIIFVLAILVSTCFFWKFIKGLLLKQRRWKGMRERETFLLFIGLLPLAAIFLLSLRQRINANWPAPFYLSLGVLLSAWAMGKTRCNGWADRLKGFFPPGIYLGLFLVVLFYLLPCFMGLLGLNGSKFDPTVRLRGWHELGAEAAELIRGFPEPDKTFVVARRRQTVSELAFYLPKQPEVYRWNGMERRVTTQYELWPGPVDKKGWDALIIIGKDKFLMKDLVACFEQVQFIKQIDIPLGHGTKRSFMAYRGIEMKHWAE